MDGMDVLTVAPACQPDSGWIGCSEAGELDDQPIDWEAMAQQQLMSSLGDPFSFEVDSYSLWANKQYYAELGEAARLAAAEKAHAEQIAVQESSVTPSQPEEQQIQAEHVSPPAEICSPVQLQLEEQQKPAEYVSPPAQIFSPVQVQSEEQQVQAVHVTAPGQVYVPTPVHSMGMLQLQIASAPPAIAVEGVNLVSQKLFAEPQQPNEAVEEVSEQMIEACEPPDAIMLDEEEEYQADPSLQGTPVPAESQKRLKLSVRTPMEGVPELHGSALRDTPSHANMAVVDQRPPEHIEGIPETNVHLPVLAPVVHRTPGNRQECLPLTQPSQMEGVPEIHLSAWAPPAKPRILAEEGSVDEMHMSVNLSEHDVMNDDAAEHIMENDENNAPEQDAATEHCATESDAHLQSQSCSKPAEGNTQHVAGCLQWLDVYVEDECGPGSDDDQNLWCGDDMGGDEPQDDDGFESEEFPEDPLTMPPDEPPEHPSVTPTHMEHKEVHSAPRSTATKSFPKGILKTAKAPGSAGKASAGPSSRRPSDQENIPGAGNQVTARTPHFAPLPEPSGDQHLSGGPEAHSPSKDHPSPSEQTSQGNGEQGEEGDKPKKKRTRAGLSLMAKHLRRKSLAMAGTKEVDGRRVSTRKKMKPLRWWCSEAKTYCRKHQSLPTVQAIIRTDQKSAQYRGLKNPAESYQAHREEWEAT